MKNRLAKNKWIIIAIIFLLMISPLTINGIGNTNSLLPLLIPMIVSTAVLLLITFLLIRLFGSSENDQVNQALKARPVNPIINKSLALLVAILLVAGTYSAIRSLGMNPAEGKYMYNNLANISGFVSIALILILRAVQNDIFWTSKSKKMKLDERQTHERHEVIEISYKIGAWLVLLNALWLSSNKAYLPALINNATNFDITSGAFFWPFYNIAIALFAMPLIVAAYRQKS